MTLNYNSLGKQLINPIIGICLGATLVPLNSKGEITSVSYIDGVVFINWNVDGKTLNTTLSIVDYDKLFTSGVIAYVEDYVKPEEPKFSVGDLVRCYALEGVINSKKYDALNGTWLYTIISSDGLFSDDYTLRYSTEEEKHLTLLDKICTEIDFKHNRTYEITIIEKKKD